MLTWNSEDINLRANTPTLAIWVALVCAAKRSSPVLPIEGNTLDLSSAEVRQEGIEAAFGTLT